MVSFSDLLSKATDVVFIGLGAKTTQDDTASLNELKNRLNITQAIYKETGCGSEEAIERLKARISAKKHTLTSTALSTTWCALDLLNTCSEAALRPLELATSIATLQASVETANGDKFNLANITTIALDTIATAANTKLYFDTLNATQEDVDTNAEMIALAAGAASSIIKSRDPIAKTVLAVKNALLGAKSSKPFPH